MKPQDRIGRTASVSGMLLAASLLFLVAALFVSCGHGSTARRHGFTETDILVKKGDGYYFNNRHEEAAAEYSRAIDLDPNLAVAFRNRANAFMALQRWTEALRDFDRAVAIDEDYAEAYLARGALYYLQGKYAEAIDDFDRTTEIDPWNSTARYYKALACEKIGLIREAVEAYKGYVHCTIPRDATSIEHAREKIRELERQVSP
jgi:tetratricopeptide (TPR) repeat protein